MLVTGFNRIDIREFNRQTVKSALLQLKRIGAGKKTFDEAGPRSIIFS
jgi:hypothetical protein